MYFLPVKGAVTILLHLKKSQREEKKVGAKVTNINDKFCETVPILDLKWGKKTQKRNSWNGYEVIS